MAKFSIVLCVEKGGIFKKEGGIHTKAMRIEGAGFFKKGGTYTEDMRGKSGMFTRAPWTRRRIFTGTQRTQAL